MLRYTGATRERFKYKAITGTATEFMFGMCHYRSRRLKAYGVWKVYWFIEFLIYGSCLLSAL